MARAVDFFRENCNMFSDPTQTPEKYNLYSGLIALAKEVEEIKNTLNNIENNVNFLRVNMR